MAGSLVIMLLVITLVGAFKKGPFSRLRTTSLLASQGKDLIIWDCDGVLVDSEALLKQGEVEALARAGFSLTVDDCVRMFSGVSPDEATKNFLREMGKPLPENFFKEQIEGSIPLFRQRLVALMKDTVQALHQDGIRMCVASGSPRNRVLVCLEVAKIENCLPGPSVFTREEVKRGKPAPDLFLHAAERMGVHPSRCLVVEDAQSGIDAAHAAGMDVIGYLGGGHTKPDWYRKNILAYDIPVTYTQQEVLETIRKYL